MERTPYTNHNEFVIEQGPQFDHREYQFTITELTDERAVIDIYFNNIW